MLVAAFCVALPAAGAPQPWDSRLVRAEASYDLVEATQLVEDLHNETGADLHLAKALLIVAELHRYEFDAIEESDRAARRDLGDLIDTAADEALDILDRVPESSDQQRLRADLFGVKIRSNFQAKRYRHRMEDAAARAIELDPENAGAYVSAAKPLLFADDDHQGDVGRAIELFNSALELNPTHEKAKLLLAYAHEKNEDFEHAVQLYEEALKANSNCVPALDGLERLRAAESGGAS